MPCLGAILNFNEEFAITALYQQTDETLALYPFEFCKERRNFPFDHGLKYEWVVFTKTLENVQNITQRKFKNYVWAKLIGKLASILELSKSNLSIEQILRGTLYIVIHEFEPNDILCRSTLIP